MVRHTTQENGSAKRLVQMWCPECFLQHPLASTGVSGLQEPPCSPWRALLWSCPWEKSANNPQMGWTWWEGLPQRHPKESSDSHSTGDIRKGLEESCFLTQQQGLTKSWTWGCWRRGRPPQSTEKKGMQTEQVGLNQEWVAGSESHNHSQGPMVLTDLLSRVEVF